MATQHHAETQAAAESHHAGSSRNPMAFLAYLWILILIPFLTDAKNDPFVKYHLKQGIALIIFDFVGWLVNALLIWIPVIGPLISTIWWIASIILVIVGLINVAQGKEKELPLIGQYGKLFNF